MCAGTCSFLLRKPHDPYFLHKKFSRIWVHFCSIMHQPCPPVPTSHSAFLRYIIENEKWQGNFAALLHFRRTPLDTGAVLWDSRAAREVPLVPDYSTASWGSAEKQSFCLVAAAEIELRKEAPPVTKFTVGSHMRSVKLFSPLRFKAFVSIWEQEAGLWFNSTWLPALKLISHVGIN